LPPPDHGKNSDDGDFVYVALMRILVDRSNPRGIVKMTAVITAVASFRAGAVGGDATAISIGRLDRRRLAEW
jgi:hypothetical protein